MKYLVILIATLAALLESVTYLGAVAKNFFLPAYFWYVLSSITILLNKPLVGPAIRLIRFVSLSSMLGYVLLVILETLNHPNYVYSVFHVNIFSLKIFVLFTTFTWLLTITSKHKLLQRLTKTILLSSLVFVAVEGFALSSAFLTKGIVTILKNPLASYRDKMTTAYGGFYPAMELVIANTPENALILIPPQGNPWEVEGNAAMVTYFLYPREVKNLEETIPNKGKPIYALIAKGSWPKTGEVDYGWPKVALPSERIWQFDVKEGIATLYPRSYNPLLDNWDWGLIEVKHE